MSSDQIQPERAYIPKPRHSPARISGRAWVKRDLEFWHRCTVERYTNEGVTVSLDNMDELTVQRDDVAQFDLEPGDLVFVQQWDSSLSGYPTFLLSCSGEAVEVDFPYSFYGRAAEHRMCLLRDVRVYCDLELFEWKIGTRVFAYKAVQFKPELFLFFPAIVRGIHHDVCMEVEFGDGETAFVPITLIQKFELNPGDMVHTCTSYVSHGTNPDERWSPCRIVARDGDTLFLQDGAGDRFESKTGVVAVLPKGYQMFDGKFEKIADDSATELDATKDKRLPTGDVYIVRTERWEDASVDPITKEHLDALMASDSSLAWSAPEWHGISMDDDAVIRRFSILWKGQPCFSWHRCRINGLRPDEEQLAKMIEIAIELDANVVGEDGEEYH